MSNAATLSNQLRTSSLSSTSGAAALENASEERTFKMQFTLVGFKQDEGFRVFTFEGIAEDRTRTTFTVRTDLALIRGYGIRVQELPLLCRGLLERMTSTAIDVAGQEPGSEERTFSERTWTYTEAEMRLHANSCQEARDAAQKKKSMRRFGLNPPGSGSRAPQAW